MEISTKSPVANVDGRLHLVPREHPELDAGLAKVGDRRGNVVLELVLDRRGADNIEVALVTRIHATDKTTRGEVEIGHEDAAGGSPQRVCSLM